MRALPLALFLAFSSACGSSTVTDITSPSATPVRCQASIQSSQSSFGPAGGTGTLTITVPRECAWTASSLASWVEITSGQKGQGEGAVAYRVLQNADPLVRHGAIKAAEQSIELTQEPAPCRFDVSRDADQIGAGGGEARIDVTTHSVCKWQASSDAPWATVAPSSGSGKGVVRFIVSPNPGPERSATVVVADATVGFTQAAHSSPSPPVPTPAPPPSPPAPPPPTPPPPAPLPSCGVQISPASRTFSVFGGQGAITVSTAPTCPWSASSNDEWLVITNGTNGTGPGEVGYVVLPNLSTKDRATQVKIGTKTHSVTQKGLPDDDDDDEEKLEGVISGRSGTCPVVQFSIGKTAVITTSKTKFEEGDCAKLTNGRKVEVRGIFVDGTLIASKVEFDD
jgi:hypothetical protein